MTDPTPLPDPVEPRPVTNAGLARGIVWSDVLAEIAADIARRADG